MDKKNTKASAESSYIQLVESAIKGISSTLRELQEKSECSPLTKRELEEQKELLQKVVDGKTLTKNLASSRLIPVESITFEGIQEFRLTEDMRCILRAIIVQLKDLHELDKQVHGQLSGDAVVMSERHFPGESSSNEPNPIWPWRVQLAPSFIKTEGVEKEKDFEDLSGLIKKILPSNEIPKDVNHLLSKLDDKDHSIDEMFLENHPCTWTSHEVCSYVKTMINNYKNSEGHIKITVRNNAEEVSSVSEDWFHQIERYPVFKEVYDTAKKENENFQLNPPALQILLFMLALFEHGSEKESEEQETGETGGWSIREVEGKLFCLFPCFLSNFVEQVFDIKVIQAATQKLRP